LGKLRGKEKSRGGSKKGKRNREGLLKGSGCGRCETGRNPIKVGIDQGE